MSFSSPLRITGNVHVHCRRSISTSMTSSIAISISIYVHSLDLDIRFKRELAPTVEAPRAPFLQVVHQRLWSET